MSNPNLVNLNNLDGRYAKPADVTSAISAQAATDAGQYVPFKPHDGIIVPPASSTVGFTSTALWPVANAAFGNAFVIHLPTKISHARIECSAAAGNIEIALFKLNRFDTLSYAVKKIATSGRIACPTPSGGTLIIPFTTTPLMPPGEYAVIMACDDTTTAKFGWNTIFDAGKNTGLAVTVDDMTSSGLAVTNAASRYYGTRALGITLETLIQRDVYAAVGDSIAALGWSIAAAAQFGGSLKPIVGAHAGARADQILPYFDNEITPYSPKVVQIMAGTNDVGQGTATSTTTTNIQTMIDKSYAAGATKIILCTIPPRNNGSGSPLATANKALWTALNTWVRGKASATILIADVANTAMALSGGDGIDPDMTYSTDGVHPNAAGQQIMINTVLPLLAQV